MKPLVIVGSGLAAYHLAREWRKYDKTTPLVMVTRTRGDFYSKPMLSTALTKGKTAADLSMKPADAMAKQLNALILTETTVTGIDQQAKTIQFGDRIQAYSNLVLALGAEPIALSLQGDAASDAVSINHLDDYARFESWLIDKKQIAILGSGLVGCELMNDLLNSGRQVTMASLDASPLARFLPVELGRVFERVLSDQGVAWHLAVSATALSRRDQQFVVQLSDGSQIQADGVISAVGLRANTALAAAAGLSVGAAINVDAYLQTSDANIYALGDCAAVEDQVLQYVAPLLLSARALAKTLSGDKTAVVYPPMPVIIKTPACPVVAIPPPSDVEGQWQISGEQADWTARFVNHHGTLLGFALLGNKAVIAARSELVAELAQSDVSDMA